MNRRAFLQRALSAGSLLSLVAACGPASTPAAPTSPPAAAPTAPPAAAPTTPPAATTAPAAAPTTAPTAAAKPAAGGARGAGGTLRILMWQAPTILNPHLSQGTKDFIAARFVSEPLLTVDAAGNLSPVLAAEVPSKDNGGLGADGKTVTYKLKQGIKWADGEPFTADDVVFTYQYAINTDTAAVTFGSFIDLASVEAADPNTVRLTFKAPTGGWFVPFTGGNGMVLPKHLLSDYIGANSRNAPFNLKSIGTGPYMVQDFKPGDVVTYVP
ncbi:MAG: peptide ABC transporter substrate-binding protein, partial [Chloroflexi bacterium]|nr:peptide ABC transporter substrate-binding protein [Chloroflexota bacterium]